MLVSRMNSPIANHCRIPGALKLALLASLTLLASRSHAQVEYVDPTIGNVGILLEPTRPTVYLPNSMVRVYPIRADAMADQIVSFPLTISSHRMDELFSIMPGQRSGPAAYDQEKTTPYYYSVRFDDSLIRTEFSPTASPSLKGKPRSSYRIANLATSKRNPTAQSPVRSTSTT